MLVNRQEGKTSAKVKPGKKGVKEVEEEEKGEYTVRRKEAPSKASSSRCPKGCVWEYLCGPARGRPVGASLPERIPGGFCSFPRGPISRRCTFGSAGYPSSLPLLPSGCFLPLLFFFFPASDVLYSRRHVAAGQPRGPLRRSPFLYLDRRDGWAPLSCCLAHACTAGCLTARTRPAPASCSLLPMCRLCGRCPMPASPPSSPFL